MGDIRNKIAAIINCLSDSITGFITDNTLTMLVVKSLPVLGFASKIYHISIISISSITYTLDRDRLTQWLIGINRRFLVSVLSMDRLDQQDQDLDPDRIIHKRHFASCTANYPETFVWCLGFTEIIQSSLCQIMI